MTCLHSCEISKYGACVCVLRVHTWGIQCPLKRYSTLSCSLDARIEEDDTPLRQIFDDVCRQSSREAAQNVSLARTESCSMYKRRRLARPALPTNHDDADSTVRHSRYAVLDSNVFYRGVADAADDVKALIFVTTQQLDMLQSSTEVFFDTTYKVVPSLYYQMLTIFASHRDEAFPAVYILMTWKTQVLYQYVFAMIRLGADM